MLYFSKNATLYCAVYFLPLLMLTQKTFTSPPVYFYVQHCCIWCYVSYSDSNIFFYLKTNIKKNQQCNNNPPKPYFLKFVLAVLVLSLILPKTSQYIKWIVSAGLAQVSEFSFVLGSRARRAGIISREVSCFIVTNFGFCTWKTYWDFILQCMWNFGGLFCVTLKLVTSNQPIQTETCMSLTGFFVQFFPYWTFFTCWTSMLQIARFNFKII